MFYQAVAPWMVDEKTGSAISEHSSFERPPNSMPLLRRLTSLLGPSQAARELKWITKHALQARLSVEDLVERRMRDEPLQYILGACISRSKRVADV